MGFMDDILAQQDGGGMLGGLPATWQYQNPDSLTPDQKKMMELVKQSPEQAGFTPLPQSMPPSTDFTTGSGAPLPGVQNGATPFGLGGVGLPPPAPATAQAPVPPTFGAGGSPLQFSQSQSLFGGNPPPAAPVFAKPPVVAADDGEEDTPAAPTANPATAPASPIGVGNVQMPRIGPAAAFAPAANANAQAPAPGPAAAPAGNGYQNFMNRLADGLQSVAKGGSMLGAIRGQPDDPAAKASQVANMTARALIAKGVDPQAAIAAVQPGNGEALKTLWNQAFTQGAHTQETDKDGNVWDVNKQTGQKTISLAAKDDKFQPVTTKNADGSETKQAFNNKTGQFSGGPPPAPPGKFSVDPELTGKDRLEAIRSVDPLYAKKLESMIAGDIPMPTGVAALRPDAKRTIEDALSIDGALSASDFATRAATRKDYASGIASRVTKSINTTIGHFATLDQAVDKLGNYSYFPKIANAVHDAYSSNMDPNYQKAKATFETNKEAAVKELDFALSGGHSSVSGSAELRDKFNRADSPEALHAAITEAMSLLQKRLESHTKAFTEGTKSQRDPQDFIYPENRQAFDRMLGGNAATSATEAPAPVALKVGQSATVNGVSIKKVSN